MTTLHRPHSVRIAHTFALHCHMIACAEAMRVTPSAWVRCVVTAAPLLPDFTPAESRCLLAISRTAGTLVREHQARHVAPNPVVIRSLARLREYLCAPVDFVPVLAQQSPPIDGIAGNYGLAISFSADEHERVKSAAKAMGKPVGAWLRSTLAAVGIPPSPPTRISEDSVVRFEQLLAAKRWSLLGNHAQDLVGKPLIFVPNWHELPPGDERLAWALDETGMVRFRSTAGALS